MPTAIFTICAKNYLAQARVLMESLRRHEPEARRFVALSDRVDGYFDPRSESFTVIEAEKLAITDFVAMSFRYDIMELATAVKPSVIRHLLVEQGFDRVIYLDPDIRLYGPLTSVHAAFEAGASSALTPHLLQPLAPGGYLTNAAILAAGCHNLGFVAVGRHPESLAALDWWEARLRHHCRRDQSITGEFVDQKWMDLWPQRCPGTRVLRDPGLNVAYWNLDHRPLRRVAGQWLAGDVPLAFLHFSGLRGGARMVPSVHRPDFDEAALGEGAVLFHDYLEALRGAGQTTAQTWPYAYGQFRDGRPIPFALRQFYREVLEAATPRPFGEDPFADGGERFTEPDDWVADEQHVTRLMLFLAERYPDLGRHFSLSTDAGRRSFRRWFAVEGRRYFGLPAWLIAATDAVLTPSGRSRRRS